MRDLRLWQLVDSAFPSGAFAHSSGLEAAWQLGRVRGPETLAAFVGEILWSCGRGALPFAGAAHREPGRLADVDAACDAFTMGEVANRASRAQGRALLRVAEAVFPVEVAPVAEAARAGAIAGHLAPVHGAVLRALDATRADAQRLLLYASARGVLSAAVRLGILGPLEAQGLQARAAPVVAEVLAACGDLALDEAAAENPLLDLCQGHQDRLYSRLFQS